MKIGFTGTRSGMTLRQRITLNEMILPNFTGEFHHGDCNGADREAHTVASRRGFRIVTHPPTNDKLRAFCVANEVRDPLPYIERNQVIVDETELLIACPGGADEELRSGTWATIRYARKLKRPTVIVFPDGTVKAENRP
jgi:hypothetical protein